MSDELDKKIYICNWCGSDSISSDANAYWDKEEQEWVLGDVHDYDYCSNCGGETLIEEMYPAREEEKFPVGTQKAVLVSAAEDPCGTAQWGQYVGQRVMGEDQELYYLMNLETNQRVNNGELVILKKVTPWQWELVEGQALEASA